MLRQWSMWREAKRGLLERDQGITHLDTGSKGWNNALWQELLSHSLALHDEVPQCVQTQLLRAGNKSTALGSSHTKPSWEKEDGMSLSSKLTREGR